MNRLPLLVALGSYAFLTGCCAGAAPRPEKYFDRQNPEPALLGFAYSVETGYWEYAFWSLDLKSREAIESPTILKAVVILHKDPDFDIPVRRIITESISHRKKPQKISDRRWDIDLAFFDDESPESLRFVFTVPVVREDDQWVVALLPVLARWPEPEEDAPPEDAIVARVR